ncbi:MAG: hypothetical protein H7138_01435 [Myxococcales bacterium]|nr:hypothetical protein [Myxococcales bacterium]
MYAGHGIGASNSKPAQSWSLTDGESLSDLDLAIALRALPAGADAVVMNNCCYGEGLFEVGRHDHRTAAEQRADTPMVCIAAAGEGELVQLSKLGDLARHTVAAAAAGNSYRQLSETFAATAVAGGTFRVDARPADRLDDRVLSPTLVRRRILLHHRPLLPERVRLTHIFYVINGAMVAPGTRGER